jgi:hypothetical protein
MNRTPCNGAQPPNRDSNVFWVEQLAGGESQKWRVWSPAVWGVWTHFSDGTSPCYENHNHCLGGHDPETLRWKGYVLGWSFKLNKACFCQLTGTAYATWMEQVTPGVLLRGQTIKVNRTQKKKGRLSVEVCPYEQVDPHGLPPDVDPRPSLYNLWELTDHGYKWAIDPMRKLDDGPEGVIGRVG